MPRLQVFIQEYENMTQEQFLLKLQELIKLDQDKAKEIIEKLVRLREQPKTMQKESEENLQNELSEAVNNAKESYKENVQKIEIKVSENGKNVGSLTIQQNGNCQYVNSTLNGNKNYISVSNGDIDLKLTNNKNKIELSKLFQEKLEIVKEQNVRQVKISNNKVEIIK